MLAESEDIEVLRHTARAIANLAAHGNDIHSCLFFFIF